MKHFFVINPHSFRSLGDLRQILLDCENSFSVDNRMDYRIYISRYPRDAVAVVHRHLLGISPEEIARIYAIGGDGILFDCLNGMAHFPNAELTCVPYGSTDNFVRVFGENAKKEFRNIQALINAPAHYMDIINCGQNYALIEANIGWVAQAVIYSNFLFRNNSTKWARSFASHVYSLAAIGAILNDDEVLKQPYTAILDGEDVSACYGNILISNSACDGGSYVPMPYAKPNDGILDVTFTDAMKWHDMLRVIGDRNKGHFERHKSFHHRKCRALELRSEIPLRIQLDGESFYAQEIKFEIIPNGIRFFAPEGMEVADYSHLAYKKKPREKGALA